MFKKKKDTKVSYEDINLNIKKNINNENDVIIPFYENDKKLPTSIVSSGETEFKIKNKEEILSNGMWFPSHGNSSVRFNQPSHADSSVAFSQPLKTTNYETNNIFSGSTQLSTAIIANSSCSQSSDFLNQNISEYIAEKLNDTTQYIHDEEKPLWMSEYAELHSNNDNKITYQEWLKEEKINSVSYTDYIAENKNRL